MLNLLPAAWVRSKAKRWPLSLADKSATRRSVNTGLARHSAITKGILPKGLKQFPQDFGLFCVLGHPLHLGLELLGSDRLLPVSLQRLRIAEIIFDLPFNLLGRHHFIERRLRPQILFRPNPVPPVHVFDGALISHTLCEGQRS